MVITVTAHPPKTPLFLKPRTAKTCFFLRCIRPCSRSLSLRQEDTNWTAMANNPSQLLPSGTEFEFIFFDRISTVVYIFLYKVLVQKFEWKLRNWTWSLLYHRIDRSMHWIEDMGYNEGRQGTRWYTQRFRCLC